jgi:hypothetical protein
MQNHCLVCGTSTNYGLPVVEYCPTCEPVAGVDEPALDEVIHAVENGQPVTVTQNEAGEWVVSNGSGS